jgi:hypothetical protein
MRKQWWQCKGAPHNGVPADSPTGRDAVRRVGPARVGSSRYSFRDAAVRVGPFDAATDLSLEGLSPFPLRIRCLQ